MNEWRFMNMHALTLRMCLQLVFRQQLWTHEQGWCLLLFSVEFHEVDCLLPSSMNAEGHDAKLTTSLTSDQLVCVSFQRSNCVCSGSDAADRNLLYLLLTALSLVCECVNADLCCKVIWVVDRLQSSCKSICWDQTSSLYETILFYFRSDRTGDQTWMLNATCRSRCVKI